MAPELHCNSEDEGIACNCTAADIYSLGATMFVVATLTMPPQGCYQQACTRILVGTGAYASL